MTPIGADIPDGAPSAAEWQEFADWFHRPLLPPIPSVDWIAAQTRRTAETVAIAVNTTPVGAWLNKHPNYQAALRAVEQKSFFLNQQEPARSFMEIQFRIAVAWALERYFNLPDSPISKHDIEHAQRLSHELCNLITRGVGFSSSYRTKDLLVRLQAFEDELANDAPRREQKRAGSSLRKRRLISDLADGMRLTFGPRDLRATAREVLAIVDPDDETDHRTIDLAWKNAYAAAAASQSAMLFDPFPGEPEFPPHGT